MNDCEEDRNGRLVVSSADGQFVEIHEIIPDGRGGNRSRLVSRSPAAGGHSGAATQRDEERQAVRRLLLDIFAPSPGTDDRYG